MGTIRDERIGPGRSTRWRLGAATLCLAGLVGCGSDSTPAADAGTTDVPVGTDGGDAGVDAGNPGDTGTDAGTDVQNPTDNPQPGDLGTDIGSDGGTDGATDAGTDAGPSTLPGAPTQFAGGPSFVRPLDAVLTASGASAYFIAYDATTGAPEVLRTMGGATTTVILSGAPLDNPTGLAISADDSRIYVADPAATASMTLPGQGAIFSSGGEPGATATVVNIGTAVHSPRAVAIGGAAGAESLTFIASDDTTGAGVFRVGTAGGTATRLDTAGTLIDPAALTVASDGSVYVLDARGDGTRGAIFHIPAAGGTPTPVVARNLRTRYPAGIALSRDEHSLLLSGWDPGNGPGLLTWVAVDGTGPTSPAAYATAATGLVSPGGLHRARNADQYIVADELSSETGAILGLH